MDTLISGPHEDMILITVVEAEPSPSSCARSSATFKNNGPMERPSSLLGKCSRGAASAASHLSGHQRCETEVDKREWRNPSSCECGLLGVLMRPSRTVQANNLFQQLRR